MCAKFHASPITIACITVPNIDPQRAVIAQYPLALTEHRNQVGNVLVRRLLQTDLLVYADCATLATYSFVLNFVCLLRVATVKGI